MKDKLMSRLLTYAKKRGGQQLVLEKDEKKLACSLIKNGEVDSRLHLAAELEEDLSESFRQLATLLPDQFYTDKKVKIKNGPDVYNCRFSVLPTSANNKKIIITIEESKPIIKRINGLGLNQAHLKSIKKVLKAKSGLILIAAPIEQGKTSTYYTLLNYLRNSEKSIYSLENYPINSLSSISVIETSSHHDPDDYWGSLQKADPDIIGIDEINNQRDLNEALQQAIKGRLIIATIKAKGAVDALQLALNVGLSPKMVATGLRLIIGQRLLRRNCLRCLQKINLDPSWKKRVVTPFNFKDIKTLMSGGGCSYCNFQGRSNLLACFELMTILPDATLAPGFEPILIDALKKAENGLFSPEEISKLLI